VVKQLSDGRQADAQRLPTCATRQYPRRSTYNPRACFALCIVHVLRTQSATRLKSPKTDLDKALCVRVCFPCSCTPCPYLRVPFVRTCLAQTAPALCMPACAFYLCVLTKSLLLVIHIRSASARPTLLSVHGCINITCNTHDIHKVRRPHSCMRHPQGRLIAHAPSLYVTPVVFSGCYHCMCGNTLTIPHDPLLFLSSAQPLMSPPIPG